jgi:hypothetical protein
VGKATRATRRKPIAEESLVNSVKIVKGHKILSRCNHTEVGFWPKINVAQISVKNGNKMRFSLEHLKNLRMSQLVEIRDAIDGIINFIEEQNDSKKN